MQRVSYYHSFCGQSDKGKTVEEKVLLTLIGSKLMGYCKNLLSSAEPVEKEFDEIVQVILNHLNHKPLIYCSRIQVLLIKSMRNESVVQYMAELQT